MRRYLILAVLLLDGCGTIFSGSTQDISFDADPDSVAVYVDGAFICKTPCSYPLERQSEGSRIIGKKEGFEDASMPLRTKINPVALGNLLSVYSWTTDFVSGGVLKYTRNGVYFNMKPKNMKTVQAQQFKQRTDVRYFALHNFNELKDETVRSRNGEYILALSELSGKSATDLKRIIKSANSEVQLTEFLVAKE